MDRVPSIDLTPFRLGTHRQPVIDEVRAACEQIGFLMISGHGIEESLLAEAFAQSRAFFDQPLPEKRGAAPPVARRQRGYHELASRNLGKTMGVDVPPDLRESFFLARSTITVRITPSLPRRPRVTRRTSFPRGPRASRRQ